MGKHLLPLLVILALWTSASAQQPTRVILTTPQGADAGTTTDPVKVDGSAVTQPVTQVSPGTNRAASGTLAVSNDAVVINAQGVGVVYFYGGSGFTGTLAYEATIDDTNWFGVKGVEVNGTTTNWSATLSVT